MERDRAETSLESETAGLRERLVRLVSPAVEGLGLELVDLILRGSGGRRSIRLDVDRAGPRGASLDDCRHASEVVGAVLDEADPIPSSYVLEVSTPGVDRPIRTPDDVRRNTGRRVEVTVTDEAGARRVVRGVLRGGGEGGLTLTGEDGGEVRIAASRIVETRQSVGFRAS